MAFKLDDAKSHDSFGWRLERRPAVFLPEPEPEELFAPIISVDDHYLEPRDLFTARVSTSVRDSVPHVEDDEEGLPYWVIGDARLPILLNSGASGRPISDWSFAPQKYEEIRKGAWDVDARVADMDVNGVWASLNFPSVTWGFAGTRLARLPDPKVGLACVRAYNDWVLDWCGRYPDRFITCQLPWLNDPEVAAAEIRSNADRGFRSVSFSENPEGLGYPSIYAEHWDPFFAACAETGTVLNLHTGSSGTISRPSSCSPAEVTAALFPVNGIASVIDWIFAKVPVRFPELKIVLSEGGVSWVPMAIERLTRAYRFREASNAWSDADGDPVEVLHRNFWFTSIEDPAGFRMLDLIGDDRVMIETDYPHFDSSWPESQSLVRRGLGHLPAESIRKVCYENAAVLYRHPLPPADMLAASVVGGDGGV